MKVVSKTGIDEIAMVYVAESGNGKMIEFVESVQPPLPREKKWVLTISSLFGCPVSCKFCDAGGFYSGILSVEEILFQIDYLVRKRYPDGNIPVEKFKIQFARTGEPSFNDNVLEALELLPEYYYAPGLMISFSTIAPKGRDEFFERLLDIKNSLYPGQFQFQFSIHTTDRDLRQWLIPVETWSFERMAEYGRRFHNQWDRKITLNFALAENMPVEPEIMLKHFDPEHFFIKITPVNPTFKARENKLSSAIVDYDHHRLVDILSDAGYDVVLSIGELKENMIGSNCGQYIMNYRKQNKEVEGGYTFELEKA
ncbi:radical SAM protein [bacterium]|nr:radical SAM protein [bacterium]